MRTIIIASLLLAVSGQAALADRACRSVYVNIENRIDRVIRVLAFWYFDVEDDTWRREDIANIVMAPGRATSGPRTATLRETLERVGDEPVTAFSVQYQRCTDPSAQNQTCPQFETQRRNSRVVTGTPAMTECRRKDRVLIPAFE